MHNQREYSYNQGSHKPTKYQNTTRYAIPCIQPSLSYLSRTAAPLPNQVRPITFPRSTDRSVQLIPTFMFRPSPGERIVRTMYIHDLYHETDT